jgi:transcriptional regulator with XRE-family HTH domain
MTAIRKRLLKRFCDREYRHSYLESFLDSLIATQIRALREREEWSQKELAERIGTKQSAISRLERPDHSAWGIKTLRALARAFDMALSVKFVSFGDAIDDIEGFRADRLIRPSFAQDPVFHGDLEVRAESADSNLIEGVDFGRRTDAPVAHRISAVESGAA